jgi:hypothetical protein
MKPTKAPDISPNECVRDAGKSDEVENGRDLMGRKIWPCGTTPYDHVNPLTAHVYAFISIRLIAVSFSHSPSLLLAV